MDGASKRILAQKVGILVLIFGLLQLVPTHDLLSDLTKPVVVSVLSLLGASAVDLGGYISVGKLHVPWSRDCSGIDMLLVLWALMLWRSRSDRIGFGLLWRFVAAFPAAVLCNAGRVLVIVLWRHLFYPAAEPPELHFFVGFLMLFPLLTVFVPRANVPFFNNLVEMCYLAAVISLVATHVGGPGGTLVTACALLVLGYQKPQAVEGTGNLVYALLWILGGVWIALTSMESMWLPWLLATPWSAGWRVLMTPALLLLVGTVPLFAVKLPWLPGLGILWIFWGLVASRLGTPGRLCLSSRSRPFFQGVQGAGASSGGECGSSGDNVSGKASPRVCGWKPGLLFLAMIALPFASSSASSLFKKNEPPPPGLMSKSLNSGGYMLRLVGQSPDIDLIWYAAPGGGRHHSLPVCMGYRGVELVSVEDQSGEVLTDGEHWMVERFLFPDGVLTGARDYLVQTFFPFSDPGVHLIAVSRCRSMSASNFEASTAVMFTRIAEMQKEAQHQGEHSGRSHPSG